MLTVTLNHTTVHLLLGVHGCLCLWFTLWHFARSHTRRDGQQTLRIGIGDDVDDGCEQLNDCMKQVSFFLFGFDVFSMH